MQERRAGVEGGKEVETVTRPVTPSGRVVLDRYELRERLGSGGFATVWRALDQRLDREVAVKCIPIGSDAVDSVAARAEREALAAARLSHPSIVALYEAGRDDETVYLVSELVHGDTLGELLADGALSDRDVLLVGAAMCDALAHAHARGVVHRDVKPGNVLIPEAGPGAQPPVVAKLTDFGIARIAGDDALTETGDVIGTLAYMAPEQADGRGAGAASDLYSIALVVYEGLAGINPIRRTGAAATARRVGTRLPPLRRLRRDLPRELCAAIDAAVLPDPADRGSIVELRDALARAVAEADDEPGTVAASRWDGLATGAVSLREATERFARWGAPDDERSRPPAPFAPPAPRELHDDDEHDEHRGHPERHPARIPVPLGGRLVAGALAGALVAACLPFAHGDPRVDSGAAALACAAVVALLPRLGWLAAAVVLTGWLAAHDAPGVAAVVAVAALPVLLLLPRRPAWWSAPGAAVLLGTAGVAGAWPALAGQARGVATRAALGAIGWWWLSLAELVRDERLLAGPPADASAPPASLHAARAGIADVLGTGTVAVGAVWAAAAVALPLLVRGRHAAADLVASVAWAIGLALATRAVAHAAGAAEPRGLVAAAALGALGAVVAGAFARRT